jgi:6-pyruvoyltetrahydropterin/6-carboxytetrahydropterin synthase
VSASGLAVELGRRYRFAASHRLHRPDLNDAENTRLYGKCNNPHGHGHNYVLEVSWAGDVDPETGMIANLADLDAFVDREVLQVFDQISLNEDVPEFAKIVPTTENVCVDIFRRLQSFPGAKLKRVLVEETSNNSFEYTGGPASDQPEPEELLQGGTPL